MIDQFYYVVMYNKIMVYSHTDNGSSLLATLDEPYYPGLIKQIEHELGAYNG